MTQSDHQSVLLVDILVSDVRMPAVKFAYGKCSMEPALCPLTAEQYEQFDFSISFDTQSLRRESPPVISNYSLKND
jgi:hypothetical protein